MKAYQRNDDEGGGRDGSTHVGPDTAAVQNAHPPGQLTLEQGAHLGVKHDLEVTLHHMLAAEYVGLSATYGLTISVSDPVQYGCLD